MIMIHPGGDRRGGVRLDAADMESLKLKAKLRRLMTYFEEDTQLRDILITGGDALMSQNKTLHNILAVSYTHLAGQTTVYCNDDKEYFLKRICFCCGY